MPYTIASQSFFLSHFLILSFFSFFLFFVSFFSFLFSSVMLVVFGAKPEVISGWNHTPLGTPGLATSNYAHDCSIAFRTRHFDTCFSNEVACLVCHVRSNEYWFAITFTLCSDAIQFYQHSWLARIDCEWNRLFAWFSSTRLLSWFLATLLILLTIGTLQHRCYDCFSNAFDKILFVTFHFGAILVFCSPLVSVWLGLTMSCKDRKNHFLTWYH